MVAGAWYCPFSIVIDRGWERQSRRLGMGFISLLGLACDGLCVLHSVLLQQSFYLECKAIDASALLVALPLICLFTSILVLPLAVYPDYRAVTSKGNCCRRQ